MSFIRPPHWHPSSHTLISPYIYRLAAFQVVNDWLYEASQVQTLSQARRDLSQLAIAALNIGDSTWSHQARFWHRALPQHRLLRDPLATNIRGFFHSAYSSEELLEAISLSDRALSVFEANDIDMVAERIAAHEDNICSVVESLHP